MNTGYGWILVAGAAWGSVGIFASLLLASGLPLMDVVWFKEITCFICLLPLVTKQEGAWPRIKKEDIKFFAGFAFVESILYNLFYFSAIRLVGASLAVVLVYTAPAFAVVIGKVAFGERISRQKIMAVVLCFTGAFLVSEGYNFTATGFNKTGVLLGLGAGFAYAVYSFCAKTARRRYSVWVTSLYANGFGVVYLSILRLVDGFAPKTLSAYQLALVLGIGVWGSLVPLITYGRGIKSVEMGKAPIVASVELVVGVVLAWVLLGERLNTVQMIGVLVIMATVGLVQLSERKQDPVVWPERESA